MHSPQTVNPHTATALGHRRLTAVTALWFLAMALPAVAADQPDRRSVSVDGHGEVSVAPDMARLQMAAQATDKNLNAAQTKVDGIIRGYVKRARALGAKDADLSTAGLTVQPQYDYSSKNGRTFLGYQVTRRVEVTVHDLDKIGDYLLQATAAGINNVSDPELVSSKAGALRLQAMAAAAQDARSKAKILAQTLDVKLGPVHTIDASSGDSHPMPMMRAMAAPAAKSEASGNSQMGFSAGEIHYTADIHANFDLLQ